MLGAFTAAVIIVIVMILLTARAFSGDNGRETVITVLLLRGDTRVLIRQIKALYWENRFRESGYRSRIVLLSCGDKENDIAAAALANKLEGVEFTYRFPAEKYLSEEYSGDQ